MKRYVVILLFQQSQLTLLLPFSSEVNNARLHVGKVHYFMHSS